MSVKRKVIDGVENGVTEKKKLKGSKIKYEKDSGTHKAPEANNAEKKSDKPKKPEKQKKIRTKAEQKSFTKEAVDKPQDPIIKSVESEKPVLDNDEANNDEANKENDQTERPKAKVESSHEKREKQKKLKSERQSKKKDTSVFDLGVQAKKVWNTVRMDATPEAEREKLLKELHGLVKGNLSKIIQAHDTVRVVECLMAKGDEGIRQAIYDELKGDLVAIAKSKYGNFFVQKLLNYGTKEQKDTVLKRFEGKIAELTRHKVANVVVNIAYNDVAKTNQQNRYLQEFFGAEFRICKEEGLKSAVEIAKKYPKKEGAIRRALAENCGILISKGCYNQSIVHTVLYNYMQLLNYIISKQQSSMDITNEKDPPKEDKEMKEFMSKITAKEDKEGKPALDLSSKVRTARAEFIAQLRDVCVHILHSSDGARLSMNALWHGSAKDRKAIIKSFKSFVPKICGEEYGHMVLLAAFDCVDDTKLITKAVISEIIGDGKETTTDKISATFASEKAGRKVLLYLIVGRDSTYFAPTYLALLKEGDGNEHSKKEDSIRRKELSTAAQDGIYKFLAENLFGFLKADPKCAIFLKGVLNCTGVSIEIIKPVMERLADIASEKFEIGADNLVESASGHMLLKKIITQDKIRASEGIPTFSQMLLNHLGTKGTLECYLKCNRGAFILVTMIETNLPELQKSVKEVLKSHKLDLKSQKTRGAEILTEKLKTI